MQDTNVTNDHNHMPVLCKLVKYYVKECLTGGLEDSLVVSTSVSCKVKQILTRTCKDAMQVASGTCIIEVRQPLVRTCVRRRGMGAPPVAPCVMDRQL